MVIETRIDQFNLPFASLIKKNDLQELFKKSNLVRYSKKETILKQDTRTSHLMLIKEGMVKIYKENRNERNQILYLAKKGNFIGATSIFGAETFHFSASSVERTEIWFIDIDVFKNVLLNNSKYAIKIINLLSQENLFTTNRLLAQISKQLPGRIADVLLYFAEDIYQSHKFVVPLTRKELAEMAGTTKESFIRTLTEFKNDKIINLKASSIEIKSMDIVKTLHNLG